MKRECLKRGGKIKLQTHTKLNGEGREWKTCLRFRPRFWVLFSLCVWSVLHVCVCVCISCTGSVPKGLWLSLSLRSLFDPPAVTLLLSLCIHSVMYIREWIYMRERERDAVNGDGKWMCICNDVTSSLSPSLCKWRGRERILKESGYGMDEEEEEDEEMETYTKPKERRKEEEWKWMEKRLQILKGDEDWVDGWMEKEVNERSRRKRRRGSGWQETFWTEPLNGSIHWTHRTHRVIRFISFWGRERRWVKLVHLGGLSVHYVYYMYAIYIHVYVYVCVYVVCCWWCCTK